MGVALDLYSFHDVSPGSAFWHPKGQRIWRTLEGAMRELQERRGYLEVSTPILVHKKLWEQSGHWDHYADNMFKVEAEGQTFSLKPMNCPESTYIYRSRLRSYRDLPLRLNEYGRLHRNERSGTLSGLTRVRQFIQDDAHIYVRPDQLRAEIEALLGEVRESYGWFGLKPRFAFATKPDKALGDPALWERAEALIKEALDAAEPGNYVVKPKDGTFYAPKIDIYIDDALGREWQMATIQVDLVMLPEQFDLTYVDEHGQHVRPMAIHRAIYGSLERFIGILVEHFAGAFPLWVAPVQAVVIPIADRHADAAREFAGVLRGRAACASRSTTPTTGCRTRSAWPRSRRCPYMLVLGDREVEARTAAPRTRAGEQQAVPSPGRISRIAWPQEAARPARLNNLAGGPVRARGSAGGDRGAALTALIATATAHAGRWYGDPVTDSALAPALREQVGGLAPADVVVAVMHPDARRQTLPRRSCRARPTGSHTICAESAPSCWPSGPADPDAAATLTVDTPEGDLDRGLFGAPRRTRRGPPLTTAGIAPEAPDGAMRSVLPSRSQARSTLERSPLLDGGLRCAVPEWIDLLAGSGARRPLRLRRTGSIAPSLRRPVATAPGLPGHRGRCSASGPPAHRRQRRGRGGPHRPAPGGRRRTTWSSLWTAAVALADGRARRRARTPGGAARPGTRAAIVPRWRVLGDAFVEITIRRSPMRHDRHVDAGPAGRRSGAPGLRLRPPRQRRPPCASIPCAWLARVRRRLHGDLRATPGRRSCRPTRVTPSWDSR